MRFLTRLLLPPETEEENGAAGEAVSGDPKGVVASREKIASLLTACCDERQIARIWAVGARQAVSGRFEKIEEEGLVFSVKVASPELKLGRVSLCTVFFLHHGYARVFFSRVVAKSAATRTVTVRVPEVIAGERRDCDLRVPIDVGTPLSVAVRRGNELLPGPSAVDVSYGGACLAFPIDAVPDLSFGESITVELGYAGLGVSLIAEVRHAQGSRYGVFFPASFGSSGEIEPPGDLKQLVDQLARDLRTD